MPTCYKCGKAIIFRKRRRNPTSGAPEERSKPFPIHLGRGPCRSGRK
jgi:hypothetical protein